MLNVNPTLGVAGNGPNNCCWGCCDLLKNDPRNLKFEVECVTCWRLALSCPSAEQCQGKADLEDSKVMFDYHPAHAEFMPPAAATNSANTAAACRISAHHEALQLVDLSKAATPADELTPQLLRFQEVIFQHTGFGGSCNLLSTPQPSAGS